MSLVVSWGETTTIRKKLTCSSMGWYPTIIVPRFIILSLMTGATWWCTLKRHEIIQCVIIQSSATPTIKRSWPLIAFPGNPHCSLSLSDWVEWTKSKHSQNAPIGKKHTIEKYRNMNHIYIKIKNFVLGLYAVQYCTLQTSWKWSLFSISSTKYLVQI